MPFRFGQLFAALLDCPLRIPRLSTGVTETPESGPAPHPLDALKAQGRAAFQLLIKPHTMPFHLAAAALAGLITVLFLAITGVMIIVATNFNPLDWIE